MPFHELLQTYLNYGGMPQIADMSNVEQKQDYLKSLFTETYLTDIRERYHIYDDGDLEELIRMIASTIGSLQNPLKLQI